MKHKLLIQNRGFESLTRREVGLLAATALFGSGTALSQRHPEAGEPGAPRWRSDFPALQQTLDGRRIAYLDSAATTHRPTPVIEALSRFYREDNANPSRALHTLARRAYERYEEARSTVASFIHARDPIEVVWVRGTTEGINLVAATWGRANLRAGDEALTEHGLRELGRIRGLTLLGPDTATDRLPVFSFSLEGWQPQDVARELDREAIAVRAGDLAAGPLLRRLGVTAAVRASCYLYTSGEEIDRLVAALQRLSTRTGGQDGGDGTFG